MLICSGKSETRRCEFDTRKIVKLVCRCESETCRGKQSTGLFAALRALNYISNYLYTGSFFSSFDCKIVKTVENIKYIKPTSKYNTNGS